MHVGRILKRTASRWPQREALVEGSRRMSYSELEESVNRFAGGLRGLGISKGDAVGIRLRNSIEQVVCQLGIQQIGAISVPINPRLSQTETANLLQKAEAKAIIVSGACSDMFSTLDDQPVAHCISTNPLEGETSYQSILSSGGLVEEVTEVDPEDISMMMHTSGTTGQPKLVVFDHQGQILNSMICAIELGYTNSDRGLHLAPLYHSAGYLNLFLPLLQLGGTQVIQREFEPESSLDILRTEQVTVVLGIPTHYARLQAVSSAPSDISSLRLTITSGAQMREDTMNWLDTNLPGETINLYGLTESTGIVTLNRHFARASDSNCIGTPAIHVDAKLTPLDDTSRSSHSTESAESNEQDAAGEVNDSSNDEAEITRGQLAVRSTKIFDGYYGQSQETKKVIRDGWLYTGDIVELKDGKYYLSGRIDNVIISGGENIVPEEIENVLNKHPDIIESVVVGEPDSDLGEKVVAYVVTDDLSLSLSDIDSYWVEDQDLVADFKRPRELHHIDTIPKNSSGEIRRKELQQ